MAAFVLMLSSVLSTDSASAKELARFKQRVPEELSFIDKGPWAFDITDTDGYALAFFRLLRE
jgi:hypothetical protein